MQKIPLALAALSFLGTFSSCSCGSTHAAPVLDDIDDATVRELETLSFSIRATDSDGDTLTLSATGLPNGASFEDGRSLRDHVCCQRRIPFR